MNARVLVACLLLSSVGLAGCASSEHRTKPLPEFEGALTDGAPAGAQPAAPPEDVSAALLPPINIQMPEAGQADTDQRFDVRVRRVSARDFFMSLVEGTPYSMVVPQEMAGTVTLDLKNVTVPEVMEVVRSTHGYEYERTRSGFTVLAEQLYTRIYHVDYLDVRRSGRSQMTASPGEVSRAGASTPGAGTGGAQQSATTSEETSYSRISTESSAEFWNVLNASLQQIVGTAAGRGVTVNSQAGVIVVRAMPSELRAVNEFLEATQVKVHRQVILEARILEVELSDGFQAGINWASLRPANNGTITGGQFGGGTVFNNPNNLSNLQDGSNLLNPNSFSTIRGTAATGFGGVFAAAVDTQDFTAFIELLKSQGEVQVLSSPRVSTVNNQKAVIKVGSDEFFVTGVDSTQTVINNQAVPNVDVTLTPFFSGVALDVMPQISAQGDIVLHVHPSVSEVSELTKNITALGQAFSLPTAASTIRESDSVVRARDGQIVVIGGLMQTRQQDEEAGVPVLSDIPLLGNLFKHTRKRKRKSELVILLKPMVVDSAESWSDQVMRSSQTIRALGGAP